MDGGQETDGQEADQAQERDGHDYVDRSKIDFDPDDGHYTGTAIDGTSDIPGSHESDEESGDENPVSEQDEKPRQE